MLSTLLRCSEVTARDGPSGVAFWPHSIIDKDKATDRLEKKKFQFNSGANSEDLIASNAGGLPII